MIMTSAGYETCGHEECDMEPCTWGGDKGLDYDLDSVWGWATTCDRCEQQFPGTLPEEHWEARHAD